MRVSVFSPLLLCTVILVFSLSAYASDQEEGQAMMSRAAQLSNLEKEGAISFRLHLQWNVRTLAGSVRGEYLLLWQSPGNWREEVSFPGYEQIKVSRGNQVWVQRNLDFVPHLVYLVNTLLQNLWEAGGRPDERVTKVTRRKERGLHLRCVEISEYPPASRTLCFDEAGHLVSEDFSPPEGSYTYSDYSDFGKGSFPHELSVEENGGLVVKAQVQELDSTEPTLSDLEPPKQGATMWPTCANPAPAQLVRKPLAEYPVTARQTHEQGVVRIYVLIAEDGSVRNPVVTQTAGKDLDASALNAVKQRRYVPARCGALPIPSETEVGTSFALQWR